MSKTSSFQPHLALSAAAGSGKTFALSVRYISLLFMGESPSSILAATFTNKAAAEMRQRVVDSLRGLGDNEAFLGAVLEQTGLGRKELFARVPEVLARFLSHGSYIVTLDSFFSTILRSASLELGLEPDFVTKEQGADELEEHFLDEVRAGGLLSSLVKLAIDIEDKRFGKIFDLMQDFYKVDPLLPKMQKVEYTLAESQEACEMLRIKLIEALRGAKAADRCIKQFETNSIKELFAKGLFAKDTLAEHSWYKKVANDEIEGLYAYLKQELAKWAKTKESIVLQNLFGIYDYYRNANISNAKSSGVLSFDDLSYFTYKLLYESIEKDFLYFKIDAKFKHILLDEFQDTSTLQFLLLKPMIDEIFDGAGQSEFRSFFYVGDTKQSLYRFRGGVEELFDKVAHRYGIEIEPMDTNYRSSKNVVEQVNRWFEPTMAGYVPQKANGLRDENGDEIEGFVEVLESDEPIEMALGQTCRLLESGVNIDDIAFLVSTNKDGQALQEACQKKGIATLLKTSSSLKNIPKIAALVAMMEYLFGGQRIDAEAMMLRVGKSLDEVDLSWFSAFMSPLQVIDRLVRVFGYFDNDPNLLKLLEFASKFSDIPTFVEEFASSSIAVASNTLHGAKIMTIHGSKGLEFRYVILLDKLTRKNSDKSALLYNYDDNLHIDKILYRNKNRENFDTEYADIIAKRKISSAKDSMNVLYVALTRAVEGMVVIRKPKDSIFDMLDMQTLQVGKMEIKKPKKESKKPLPGLYESPKTTISHYGTQQTATREDEGGLDHEAILFGTALHYGLEMLGGFDEQSLDSAMTAVANKYGQQLSLTQLDEISRRMLHLIRDEEFQSLLKNAKISKEQTLVYQGEIKQIDLLLEYEDCNLVIDYKSSQKFVMKHQAQVRFYQKAIASITGKRCKGRVVYLQSEGISFTNLN